MYHFKRSASSIAMSNISFNNNKKRKLSVAASSSSPCTAATAATAASSSSSIDPAQFAMSLFENNNNNNNNNDNNNNMMMMVPKTLQFNKPTPEMMNGYTSQLTNTVRENNLSKLQQLHESGQANLHCCNAFGNTLLHLACRRGLTDIVRYLVDIVQVNVNVVDDLNRTPMHDACWTSEPNFEIMELLLRKAPEQVSLADVRGHTPFDYARKSHWGPWVEFLTSRQTLLTGRRDNDDDNNNGNNVSMMVDKQ